MKQSEALLRSNPTRDSRVRAGRISAGPAITRWRGPFFSPSILFVLPYLKKPDLKSPIRSQSTHKFWQRPKNKKVQPETIRKELATFRQIRHFAKARQWVSDELSLRDVKLPKSVAKRPFKTWDEIKRTINRGGLSKEEEAALWDCLFLREKEIIQLLGHVRKRAAYPCMHPLFAFAALTGGRRSEILRSQVDDFNFDRKFVLIRERM